MRNQNQNKRVTAFVAILLVTFVLVRILTHYNDLDILIFGYELHHFYYGITLLAIVQLAMLFGNSHPRLYLYLSAFAFGLVADEFLFIMGGFRNQDYGTTFTHAVFIILVVLSILGIILADFLGRFKGKERK